MALEMSDMKRAVSRTAMGAALAWLSVMSSADGQKPVAVTDPDGTVHIASLAVPPSSYASQQARDLWVSRARQPPAPGLGEGVQVARAYYGKFNDTLAARMKVLYPVNIEKRVIDGVRVEIITPKQGPLPGNEHRVLINLHGGAFAWGEGSGGEVEAIPISSAGRIEVITIAYAQGPEHSFPAASEDVAAVYRHLLNDHKPGQIGIYGCSAGGFLTAESVAWFDHVGLPQPAAIGMFCAAAGRMSGDSLHLAPALAGGEMPEHFELQFPYFAQAHVSEKDPLVYPINSPQLLARFPPSLLIAGSRDFAVSSLFQTQRELVKQGVEVELHVWDGLPHAFFVDPDLPESREVYSVVVRFFDRHLGR
jgi:epsilon-lactone hydrolase